MGPFPAVPMSSVPESVKTVGVRFPVEVGTFIVEGDKIKQAKYEGEVKDFEAAKPDEPIAKAWNKKGDLTDLGFGALFAALGVELPPPPAAA